MNERDLIPLDAGEGHRTPTSGGDRLMLLLAGLALAGGLAIMFGNLLPPPDDETAVASTAATATSQPSRTPRPSPTPRPLGQILVTPADPPASGTLFWWRQEWIRALQDLPIRSSPAPDASAVGLVAAGDLALAQQSDGDAETPGWLYVVDGGPSGWVQVEAGGTQLAEHFSTDSGSWASLYAEVVAGDTGFIAQAADGTSAISSDGVSWVAGEGFLSDRGGPYGTAWGPAGWLAVSSGSGYRGPTDPYLWRSDDGRDWVPIGLMATEQSGFGFNGLWGSRLGYLMLAGGDRGQPSFWFSTNGIAWLEMPATGLERNDAWFQVSMTADVFYVADGNSSGRTSAPAVYTADGGSWQDVHGGPADAPPLISALPDRLIALDRIPESDAIRVWIGTVGREGVEWVEEPSADATFAGTVPAALVSDDQRVVAIGWDRETEEIRSWSSPDGRVWTPLALPPGGFGVIPHQAVGTAAGIIVMGMSNDDGIQALQPWRLVGTEWLRSNLPVVLGIDRPDRLPCPDSPRDALDFILLDAGVAVHCFEDAPITFTAYSAPCEGCFGGSDPTVSPEWLALGSPQIYLSPIVTENANWLDIVLDPSLEASPTWQGAWVDVVGHFDDPAAAECRQQLDRDSERWYGGRQQLIEECRRRFVITEVTVVDGP